MGSTQYTAAFMVTRLDRSKSILGSGESKRTTILDAGGLNGEDPVEVLMSLKNQVDLALTRQMGLKEEQQEQERDAKVAADAEAYVQDVARKAKEAMEEAQT